MKMNYAFKCLFCTSYVAEVKSQRNETEPTCILRNRVTLWGIWDFNKVCCFNMISNSCLFIIYCLCSSSKNGNYGINFSPSILIFQASKNTIKYHRRGPYGCVWGTEQNFSHRSLEILTFIGLLGVFMRELGMSDSWAKYYFKSDLFNKLGDLVYKTILETQWSGCNVSRSTGEEEYQ